VELTGRVPYDATAVRPSWTELPPAVRARIEQHVGDPVARAQVATGGFTRGFAALVTSCAGVECFVKAASMDATPIAATSYATEARVLASLPAGVPAPRLLWSDETDGWVLLGITAVAGHIPGLPWTELDLDSAVAACEQAAEALTPAPGQPPLQRLADDLIREDAATTYFARAAAGLADLTLLSPWARDHLLDLQRLTLLAPEAVDGDSACHGDLRADNLIVDATGRTWICDWNWLSLAAPWTDLAGLLVSVHADRFDADAVFRGSWLGRDVDEEAVDAWLAVIAEFMLSLADETPDFASPWLRGHRRFFGTSALSWLEHRRR
jgi:aminoglycoside phosphotransferase (APT) family kinase protein